MWHFYYQLVSSTTRTKDSHGNTACWIISPRQSMGMPLIGQSCRCLDMVRPGPSVHCQHPRLQSSPWSSMSMQSRSSPTLAIFCMSAQGQKDSAKRNVLLACLVQSCRMLQSRTLSQCPQSPRIHVHLQVSSIRLHSILH